MLHDLKPVRECCRENRILRKIAPEAIEPNDRIFVAVDESDRTGSRFLNSSA